MVFSLLLPSSGALLRDEVLQTVQCCFEATCKSCCTLTIATLEAKKKIIYALVKLSLRQETIVLVPTLATSLRGCEVQLLKGAQ